jgi:hypothetical protein
MREIEEQRKAELVKERMAEQEIKMKERKASLQRQESLLKEEHVHKAADEHRKREEQKR